LLSSHQLILHSETSNDEMVDVIFLLWDYKHAQFLLDSSGLRALMIVRKTGLYEPIWSTNIHTKATMLYGFISYACMLYSCTYYNTTLLSCISFHIFFSLFF
jgi:hypothetical protein